MAMFIPTLGDIYGSIGGITFSTSGSGLKTIRRKSQPTIRRSAGANESKGIFSQCVYRWNAELDDADRTDWNSAAALFYQERHGEAYTISGFNAFCGFHSYYKRFEDTWLDAPTVFAGRCGNTLPDWTWTRATKTWTVQPSHLSSSNEIFYFWYSDCALGNRNYPMLRPRRIERFEYGDPAATLTPTGIDLDTSCWCVMATIDIRGAYSTLMAGRWWFDPDNDVT